ncbi:hypothetical protein BGX38DRAFT_1277049 [Terfezia claveryi]|nr:hypothetical protein BGX38DRAFT_1277049 [Terfezia claveryi]
MSTPQSFISLPSSRSLVLLGHTLTIYPTLQSILSYSHRSDIIHLANTCRGFNSILRASVAPLCSPFPTCTSGLTPCLLCGAIVCEDCKQEVQELEKPSVVMSRLRIRKALVLTPDTNEPRLEILSNIRTAMIKRSWPNGLVPVAQNVEVKTLCTSCFIMLNDGHIPNQVPVERRVFRVINLEWNDILDTDTLCTCTPDSVTQCGGEKHLVGIEDVPAKSELAALVDLPLELSSTSGTEVIALYILDDLFPISYIRLVE